MPSAQFRKFTPEQEVTHGITTAYAELLRTTNALQTAFSANDPVHAKSGLRAAQTQLKKAIGFLSVARETVRMLRVHVLGGKSWTCRTDYDVHQFVSSAQERLLLPQDRLTTLAADKWQEGDSQLLEHILKLANTTNGSLEWIATSIQALESVNLSGSWSKEEQSDTVWWAICMQATTAMSNLFAYWSTATLIHAELQRLNDDKPSLLKEITA